MLLIRFLFHPFCSQSSSSWQLQRKCPEAYKALQVIILPFLMLVHLIPYLYPPFWTESLSSSSLSDI